MNESTKFAMLLVAAGKLTAFEAADILGLTNNLPSPTKRSGRPFGSRSAANPAIVQRRQRVERAVLENPSFTTHQLSIATGVAYHLVSADLAVLGFRRGSGNSANWYRANNKAA